MDLTPITSKTINKVVTLLLERFENKEQLIKLISDLDTLNTYGCFTNKGREEIRIILLKDPVLQNIRLDILQVMAECFLQEGINLASMSAYLAEIYTPLTIDRDLKIAYGDLLPEYKDSLLNTYGVLFIQSMILKTIGVKVIKACLPTIVAEKEEQNKQATAEAKRNYIQQLTEIEDKDERPK